MVSFTAVPTRTLSRRIVTVALLALGFTTPGWAAGRQFLRGHVPPVAQRLQAIDRLAATEQLELAIALPLRNREALTNLLEQIYDPASPNYHHYLTSAQFAEQFGPAEKDYEAVAAFAKAHGLVITGRHPNRTLLDVSGSVAAVENAFHVGMHVYRHPAEARSFRAPDAEPSLDLDVPVLSISGLDDFILPRPMNLRTIPFDQIGSATAYAAGSGPKGDFIGKDFRAAYAPGVSLDGAGQSVGLFELDGYFPNDITAYENLTGLPNVPVTNVLVGTATGRAGGNNVEVALDIEMAISMAPGLSNVIVYEGRVATPNDVLNRMATDNLAKQLSCSWGFGAQVDPAREQIFQQYAAQGQSMFQASGDFGAWVGTITPPSDDPWVTVVGGTALTTSSPGGAWSSETTWFGSGGGISANYAIPSWQQGINMVTNQGSTTMRNIPDVAALADGVILVVANNGVQGKIGGTSASAPIWAGFAALANQQAAASGKPSLGFMNPALYAIGKGPAYAASLHDITTGNNTNGSSANKFLAVPGYDLCTGWGTPAGSNLINALFAPPDALRITPGSGLAASGPAGGPFSPVTQNYSLTNIGTAPFGWTLVNTSIWLNAAPVSGTLTPGGAAAIVTLSMKPAASNLVAGSYSTTLSFNNLGNGVTQIRPFTLAVVTPPAITSQPGNQAVLEGATAVFSVGTASNALVFYQWQFDNGSYVTNLTDSGNISGSRTGTLTVSNATSANVGAYSAIVSNGAGTVISSSAFLTLVPSRPVITAQPASQTALPGQTLTFSVTAVGSQPLLYRWQENGTNLSDGGNLSGSATSILTVTNVTSTNAGTYAVTVTNALGFASSTGAVLTVVPVAAPGISLTTVYSFGGGNDGANPNALVQGTNGNLYGTTQNGGTNSSGTVFRMANNGTPATIYSFTRVNDGAKPFAALAQGNDGNFYGSTYQGGTNDFGSLFKITDSGVLTTLRSLDYPDGILPYSPLIQSTDGNFYGTGYEGGSGTFGTVFKLMPAGGFNALYSFAGGADGGFVYGGVLQSADGILYGTTYRGGALGFGTVFTMTTNGLLSTLFSFNNTNGAFPMAGLARGSDGNFYGTTSRGGNSTNGTIFKITPSGLFTSLYSFTGGSDGAVPSAALAEGNDGNFYGTTAYGGTYGVGTIFRVAPNGTFATLAQLDGLNGANPIATILQAADGSLYGTTQNGGASGRGTIFRLGVISAPPQITTQPASQSVFAGANVVFNVAVFGSQPLFFQWRKNGTNLTDGGNISGSATRALRLGNVATTNAGAYSVVVSNSLDSVTSADAFLQVTSSPPFIVSQPTNQTLTPGGSAAFTVVAFGNLPLAYQWQKNGANLTDTGNISGASSSSLSLTGVTEANNGTYAVIVSNALDSVTSTGAMLTVIPVSAPGTRLATLYSFTGGNDGGTPNGLVQGTNGALYGTTQLGGTNFGGTIFTLTTNGPVTTLLSFKGTNGSKPLSALVQGPSGDFYGTTEFGGVAGAGTVFKFNSSGSLTSLYSFTGDLDGSNPFAPLAQGTNGNFYGTTEAGGTNGYGTVFRISTNGVFASLYSFTNGADGSGPTGGLVQGKDGSFYGMTGGGANNFGNVFKITPGGSLVNVYSFTGGTDGNVPAGELVLGTDGNFYGTTTHNTIQGFQFYGTIFKMTPAGAITTLYALNYTDGSYPYAGVIQSSDGNFYGTTYQGGANGNGTVFSIAPNGAFTSLVSFDGFDDGAHPAAPLVQATDGAFYGTTTSGGPGGKGTVFRLSIISAPQITMQPANRATVAGADATFSVAIFGSSPLFYQWRKDGTNLTDAGSVFGSTNRVLSLSSVTASNVGTYSVVVSNALGSVTSAGATLTLVSAPVFQSITRTGNIMRVTWSAAAGLTYQLQFKTDLTSATWTNLGGLRTASGPTVTVSDAVGANVQRFYRVLLMP